MDLAINSRLDLVRRPVTERLAELGLEAVTDLAAQSVLLRQRRAGHIVVANGNLQAVFGRWWPYMGNQLRAAWDRRKKHSVSRKSNGGNAANDRCDLYFHTPLSAPQFLTLSYVHSSDSTSFATVYVATLVLDEVARIKGSLAIVANVTNDKISDRVLSRWGWQPHCLNWSGRHFIKRFYEKYPSVPPAWRPRLYR